MKREDLEAREFGLIIASSNFPFYAAPEADAVMDAMEARIKELEEALNNAVTGGKIALERAKILEKRLEDVQNTMATENNDLPEKEK